MNLNEIASWLGLPETAAISLSGVSIDTRTLVRGELFVALKGERFDGHDYIYQAFERGAAAILCCQPVKDLPIPQLIMPCTLDALALIATRHRKRLGCETIALTGSNGKTTVKEMIASILPEPSLATKGNLNNHIGVPLNLLKLTPQHRYAVFELGANHMGEIAHTVSMVLPKVALINNVGPAHLAGFGSLEGVAKAKGEIYQGLTTNGFAAVNADDAFAHAWDNVLKDKRVIRFSMHHPEEIYAKNIEKSSLSGSIWTLVTPMGEKIVHLKVPGQHNIANALAAAACTYALGLDIHQIVAGLEAFTGVAGRLALRLGKKEAHIIDDTYNANLRSVLAALDVLAAQPGQRIFVLGDLGELGDFSEAHHQEIGRAAKERGIDCLMTCGELSQFSANEFGAHASHYSDQNSLLNDLLAKLDHQTTVLVKGSRSSAMERIVQQLL